MLHTWVNLMLPDGRKLENIEVKLQMSNFLPPLNFQ